MQTQALATDSMQDSFVPFAGGASAFDALLDFERRAAEHVAGAAEQVEAPLTYGLWRPVILLPPQAARASRKRTVMGFAKLIICMTFFQREAMYL